MPEVALPAGTFIAPSDRRVVRVRDLAARLAAMVPGSPAAHYEGFTGCMAAAVARAVSAVDPRPIVCVTGDAASAKQLADDLAFFCGGSSGDDLGSDVLSFAPSEASPYADVGPDRRAAVARLVTLSRLVCGPRWRFLVLPAVGLARKVVPPSVVEAYSSTLGLHQQIERNALVESLTSAGYLRVPVVEDPATFAVRGAIVDLWPACNELPVRLEFDADEVVSLRSFDPETQRTLGDASHLTVVRVPPAREAIVTPATAERASRVVRSLCDGVDVPSSRARALIDDVTNGRAFFGAEGFLPAYFSLEPVASYLPPDALVLIVDPPAVTRAVRDEIERAASDCERKSTVAHFPMDELYATEAAVVGAIASRRPVALHRVAPIGASPTDALPVFESSPEQAETVAASDPSGVGRAVAAARPPRGVDSGLGPLVKQIAAFRDAGLSVFLVARTSTQADRLASLVRNRDIGCRTDVDRFDPNRLQDPARAASVTVMVGPLARGVVAPGEGYVLITEEEIFGQRARRARLRRREDRARPFVEDLRALRVGDHVVHVEHGVGRYLGLVHRAIGGITVDLLAVEYADGDKLYLPVYRLNQIQKWSGGDGAPKLDRLGGQTFARTKTRVARKVRQMADELLQVYAERRSAAGDAVGPADDDYRALEATFPFEETPDQARAIDDVSEDLEAPRPMDRLVCGDVGFGKTEVAIRAAFRVAQAGRQVAVLCPTTVLAEQHWLSFQARIGDYPIRVALLSRFRTKQQQADVVRGLKDGTVDIVVGTHRLLSKDVHFRKLGLLVVDEEQRFGVAHKERIKRLKTNVDILTLTATPIPRTLQLAIGGVRDMSVIATPPVDRRSIRTIVSRADDGIMREAIRRELGRGGQVFYVRNRVDGIQEHAAKLQALVPEARVAVAHGQMAERALERTMLDFVDGRYDVLVATAIIENGLDIPRANTILIDRADTFGLAQLYQLRGRVGRSKDRGYCYLMVPTPSAMTDEARARVEALERHTDLGSGFQIASLDLEIRGAGDLLGADQSGAAAVGLDLFCRMLDEAVHELRGEPVVHEVDPELSFDTEALLPEDYVADVGVRLSLYKRLAGAEAEDDVTDLAAEMEDRFGPAPFSARQFVQLMRVKIELRHLRVLGCEASAKSVTLHLREDTPLDPAKLTALVSRKGTPYRLTPDMRLTRRTAPHERAVDGLESVQRMLGELAACWRAA